MATGSDISAVLCAAATVGLRAPFSQYSRADEVALFVSQVQRDVVQHLALGEQALGLASVVDSPTAPAAARTLRRVGGTCQL